VEDRHFDILRIGSELRLGVVGDEGHKGLAVLVGMNLAAEDILQVFVFEDRGCDRCRDPQDLFLCVDLGGERHRVSAGVNAVDDLDLLLIDQPLHFIDRDIHLALTIGIDGNYLVLAGDAAALVDKINRDLRARRTCRRATGSEWTGQVIDDANPNGLRLSAGEAARNTQCRGSGSGVF
jgi:hypothetical protein